MIVAECSQNFTNLAEAKELVRYAKFGGADLAKAQLFDSAKLYKEKSPAELSFGDAKALFEYGEKIGIEVFFSVFDTERVKWCEEIGVRRYKIAYSQRDNKKLIEKLLHTNKCLMASVDKADCYVRGAADIFLYCVPHYPAPIGAIDFSALLHFQAFSDHTIGLDAAKKALARGAEIIEKHFAIDHKTGVDAQWSMIPSELKELKEWEQVCKAL